MQPEEGLPPHLSRCLRAFVVRFPEKFVRSRRAAIFPRMRGFTSLVVVGLASHLLTGCSKDSNAATGSAGVTTVSLAAPASAEPKNAAPPTGSASALPIAKAAPAAAETAPVNEGTPIPEGQAPVLEVQEVAETGSMPKGAKLSRDGKQFFVTNFGQYDTRSVTIYDSKTLELQGQIDLPGVNVESDLSADGNTLVVSNFHRSSVIFVDIAKRAIAKEISVGKNPKVLVTSPDGKFVFTANWASNDVTQVDVEAGKVLRTLKAGRQPRGMAMTRKGKLFVANFFGESLDIFEGDDLSKRHRIPICKCPRHLTVSPDDKTLYISCLTASQLHALDIETEKVVNHAPVGDAPKSIDVSADGRWVYTADYGETRSVSIVDTKSWVSRTFPIQAMDRASGVAVAPDGRHALVTGWYDGHVYLVGFQGTGGHPEEAKAKMRKWQFVPRHPDPGD